MSSKNYALIIICRYPYGGSVKSRLAKMTSPQWAAALYTAFLRDILDWAAPAKQFDLLLSLADGHNREALSKLFSFPIENIFSQKGSDFGERLLHSYKHAFTLGYERVTLSASDVPELSLKDVLDSFEALNQYDVGLSPAPDGGWTMMSLTSPVDVYKDVAWSTSSACEDMVANIKSLNLKLKMLLPIEDVDNYETLEKFKKRLQGSTKLQKRLKHTTAVLL